MDIIEQGVNSVPSLLTNKEYQHQKEPVLPHLGQWTVKPDVVGVEDNNDQLQSNQNRHVQISPPAPSQKIFHFSRFSNLKNKIYLSQL